MQALECPLCEFTCKKDDKFVRHLEKEHGETSSLEEIYVKHKLLGVIPKCLCGCEENTTFYGWNKGFARVKRFHVDPTTAEENKKKRQEGLKRAYASGRFTNPQKGKKLSGETLERRRTTRQKMKEEGTLKPNVFKGQTKENNNVLAKKSQNLKERFASGELTPWAKGLSKENDERIAKMALKCSMTLKKKEIREHLDNLKRRTPEQIRELIEGQGKLKIVSGLESYVRDVVSLIRVTCTSCGAENELPAVFLFNGRCRSCEKVGSAPQHELAEWLLSLGVTMKQNDRSTIGPQELDILLPEKNLAIEFNGLYYHSENYKSTTYHDEKTKACAAAGVKLFHVFEDEWNEKKSIIKSMLMHRLGLTPRRLGARACEVVELDRRTRSDFFDENHIDEDVVAFRSWGLRQGDELVAAASFRQPFHKKWRGHVELARFCCKRGVVVGGALGKLMKVAKQELNAPILTYVDMRHGDGHAYETVGFMHVSSTPPRFWWTDYRARFNRFKFRADGANGLSEKDVAKEHRVVKLWGCSNKIYLLR